MGNNSALGLVAGVGVILTLIGLVALYFVFWPAALIITGAAAAIITLRLMSQEQLAAFIGGASAAGHAVGWAIVLAAALAVGFLIVGFGINLMRNG